MPWSENESLGRLDREPSPLSLSPAAGPTPPDACSGSAVAARRASHTDASTTPPDWLLRRLPSSLAGSPPSDAGTGMSGSSKELLSASAESVSGGGSWSPGIRSSGTSVGGVRFASSACAAIMAAIPDESVACVASPGKSDSEGAGGGGPAVPFLGRLRLRKKPPIFSDRFFMGLAFTSSCISRSTLAALRRATKSCLSTSDVT
mmetsp:Transcript_12008/g.30361  ORF Transcript_12008/g.30361 Transcript_12008/m.30361 type:complete len:204 (-) Transcript_12008:1053-1664(-)